MEELRKLKIYCLSDSLKCLNNIKRILISMEKKNVKEVKSNSFSTPNAVYVFVNCMNLEKVKRLCADQVIIDYREPMRSIAIDMLRESCVPEQYQVIDVRKIGVWR